MKTEEKAQRDEAQNQRGPAVKDSVLEMRTRMSRLMSIVEITPQSRLPVPACVHFLNRSRDIAR